MNLLKVTWNAPVAEVELSRRDIALLRASGEGHYDARCKQAVTPGPGGFIHGWAFNLDADPRLITTKVTGDFSKFDTAAKILEMPAHATPADGAARSDLYWKMRGVLKAMNEFVAAERARLQADEMINKGAQSFPVTLYFGSDADRNEFIATVQEVKPGLKAVKL